MCKFEEDALEATEEQLALLRDLGAEETELENLAFEDAEDLIAELRAESEDAGRMGGR